MRLLGGTPYIYSSVLGYALEGAVIVQEGAEQHKLALNGAVEVVLPLLVLSWAGGVSLTIYGIECRCPNIAKTKH